LLDLLESRGASAYEAASLDETRKLVRKAVDQLPDFLRQVVLLAYFQGLPYRDVAEALGIPVGTVKSRLHAAIQRLHESWTACPSVPET
jgi:RNA polymerase sigma-70 factor (ECF subfamily)